MVHRDEHVMANADNISVTHARCEADRRYIISTGPREMPHYSDMRDDEISWETLYTFIFLCVAYGFPTCSEEK